MEKVVWPSRVAALSVGALRGPLWSTALMLQKLMHANVEDFQR